MLSIINIQKSVIYRATIGLVKKNMFRKKRFHPLLDIGWITFFSSFFIYKICKFSNCDDLLPTRLTANMKALKRGNKNFKKF